MNRNRRKNVLSLVALTRIIPSVVLIKIRRLDILFCFLIYVYRFIYCIYIHTVDICYFNGPANLFESRSVCTK